MMSVKKTVAGLAGLAVLAGAFYGVTRLAEMNVPDQTIKIAYGGEKSSFLSDPQVIEILDKKGFALDKTKAGSVEMVSTMDTTGYDCLWPSNAVAADIARESGKGVLAVDNIFNSPLVLFSWDSAAAALIKNGYAREESGVIRADMSRFKQAFEADTKWLDLGIDARGSVRVFSTDPVRSNSGNMLASLLAILFNGDQVPSAADLPVIGPKVVAYFRSLGYMEGSSGDIFQNFIAQGEKARPVIAGYENQTIELILESPEHADLIAKRIRTLYPEPTVFVSHPMISLTPACRAFSEALTSPEVLDLAWEKHGFRSGVAGVSRANSKLPDIGFTQAVGDVTQMPSASFVNGLTQMLQ